MSATDSFQQRRGGLLQRRGRERRLRPLRRVLLLHIVQGHRHRREVRRQRIRLGAFGEAQDPAAGIDHRRPDRLSPVDGQQHVDAEELLRREDPDLLVARRQDRQRGRLHPARRESRAQPPAQQRRHREPDHPAEEPARLLGAHQVVVDPARALERGAHRLRGYLREGDPAEAVLGPAQQVPQAPREHLPLAVEVGGQPDSAAAADAAQLANDLRLRVDDLPGRLPAALDIQPQGCLLPRLARRAPVALRLRQVAHVPERGPHHVATPENLVDLARLSGRFDDYEVSHNAGERNRARPRQRRTAIACSPLNALPSPQRDTLFQRGPVMSLRAIDSPSRTGPGATVATAMA